MPQATVAIVGAGDHIGAAIARLLARMAAPKVKAALTASLPPASNVILRRSRRIHAFPSRNSTAANYPPPLRPCLPFFASLR